MYAYPDKVSLAILEYYAFEAGSNFKEEARKNFRILTGSALQDFIYTQTGYDPAQQIPAAWQLFHDRVSLVYDSVPAGHFSIFKEIADLIVTLIRGGAPVGPSFIPDGSVGIQWGNTGPTATLTGDSAPASSTSTSIRRTSRSPLQTLSTFGAIPMPLCQSFGGGPVSTTFLIACPGT